jgi:hypothetical protein
MRIARVVMMLTVAATLHGTAQIARILPFDISDQIARGKASVTIVPASASDSTKPFDGNRLTEYAQNESDSLVVTLTFDSLVTIEKSKVFLWNGGKWRLEAASSLADLNARSGSYALLVNDRSFSFFVWDSLMFPKRQVQVLRLRAFNPDGPGVYLGEWTLEGTVTYTNFVIYPAPLLLVPGASTRLTIKIRDDRGKVVPNFLTEPLDYGTANPSVARIEQDGSITGKSIGSTTVTVRTDGNTLSGSAPVTVVEDFRSQNVSPMTIKVAVVYQDPVLPSSNRIHEEFNWRDPRRLAAALVRHFREATDSVVNFELTEVVEATQLFTRLRGSFMTVPQYVQLLKEPNWSTLKAASDSNLIKFDYREFVKYYHFDEKRNRGEIDEVWVFAAPYLGMWESQLMGPNAFWWNSEGIKDGTALTRLLSVMGLNYERGVDQAFHSFGHRAESAIRQAYKEALGKPWDPTSTTPTPWDLFTRIDKDLPGLAHVGNIHFPPNGTKDYDYGNATLVNSFAENWYRYPILFNMSRQVNMSTWIYTPGEPLAETQTHLGYLRWWYDHLPRYVGITDGVLNNWWHYIVDYEGAVALSHTTSVDQPRYETMGKPEGFRLEQNFPNPFNPETEIRYQVSGVSLVTLVVYDLLGREVATLVDEAKPPGLYTARFDGHVLASGVYMYRLQSGGKVETRKMMVLR